MFLHLIYDLGSLFELLVEERYLCAFHFPSKCENGTFSHEVTSGRLVFNQVCSSLVHFGAKLKLWRSIRGDSQTLRRIILMVVVAKCFNPIGKRSRKFHYLLRSRIFLYTRRLREMSAQLFPVKRLFDVFLICLQIHNSGVYINVSAASAASPASLAPDKCV